MDYVSILCSTAIACGLGGFFFPIERLSDGMMAVLFLATLSTLGAYIWSQRQLYGEIRFTPNVVISSALFIWHLGFVGIYSLGFATNYRVLAYFEIAPHSNIQGVALVTAGIAAFILGLTCGERKCAYSPPRADSRVAMISALVLASGVMMVCAYFAIKGRSLVGDYNSVYTEADSQRRAYNFGLMLAIVGLAPAITFANARYLVVSAIGGALMVGVVAALMGTRWVFLVMLALILSALQLRGQRISLWWVGAVGVICLFASIVVKERRAGHPVTVKTIGDYFNGRYTHPAVEFFEETGQALIVCIYSASEYQSVKRMEMGRTFLHAARSVLPGGGAGLRSESPMFTTAQDLFPERFANEGFTIGYSVFAEWFVNFGIVGVLLGSGCMGYGLGAVWRSACAHGEYFWTALSYSLTGYLTFGFRNDAMTWLRFVVWATAIVAMVAWVERVTRHVSSEPVRSQA